MPKPRPSVTKRQREQSKRDKQVLKAERKAQRKSGELGDEFEEVVRETPEPPSNT